MGANSWCWSSCPLASIISMLCVNMFKYNKTCQIVSRSQPNATHGAVWYYVGKSWIVPLNRISDWFLLQIAQIVLLLKGHSGISKKVGPLLKMQIKSKRNDVQMISILYFIGRQHIKCWNWEIVLFSEKYMPILNVMPTTRFKKSWDGGKERLVQLCNAKKNTPGG